MIANLELLPNGRCVLRITAQTEHEKEVLYWADGQSDVWIVDFDDPPYDQYAPRQQQKRLGLTIVGRKNEENPDE